MKKIFFELLRTLLMAIIAAATVIAYSVWSFDMEEEQTAADAWSKPFKPYGDCEKAIPKAMFSVAESEICKKSRER